MALTDSIRHWAAKTILKWGNVVLVPQWERRSFMQPTFRNLAVEGYRGNGIIFACLSAWAFSFPEPPLLVWEEGPGGRVPLPMHGLSQLLRRPNPQMGLSELLQFSIVYMGIGGNCYWYKVRSAAGRPVELWPLHDGQINPVAGEHRMIDHYEFLGATGAPLPIPAEDIVHFKWMPDPLQPQRGLGPLMAVLREVDTDNEATRYVFALLKNDAMPRLAITVPETRGELSPEEHARLREEFTEKHGGTQRGGIALLEAGLDIRPIALNLKEMEFGTLRDVPEARLCSAFRVPAVVVGANVGLSKGGQFANHKESVLDFTERSLVPAWGMFDDKVTADLLPEFGGTPRQVVMFDTDRVVALADKRATERQWALTGLTAGGLLVNEFRAAAGLPPDDGGNIYLRGFAVTEVPGRVPAPAKTGRKDGEGWAPCEACGRTDRADPDTKCCRGCGSPRKLTKDLPRRGVPKSWKALSPDLVRKAEAAVAAQRAIRAMVVRHMESGLDDWLTQLADRVVARARKDWTPKRVQAKDLPNAEDLLTDTDADELTAIIKRYFVELLGATWPLVDAEIGITVAFDLKDPAVIRVLATAGQDVRKINQTTLDELRRALQYGADQGWSIQNLVAGDAEAGILGLRQIIEEVYKGRARTIARTELGTAQNLGTAARYRAAGLEHVLIFDDGQGDEDEECVVANGAVWTLDEFDENPLEHPNCVRCGSPYLPELMAGTEE
jgi:HK97 family phage portal protein